MTTTRFFDEFGRPLPHPCAQCGRPTIFYRCDPCFYGRMAQMAQQVNASLQQLMAPATTDDVTDEMFDMSLFDTTRYGLRMPPAQLPTASLAEDPAARITRTPRTQDDVEWMVALGEIGGARDGDEFRRTLEALDAAPVSLPERRDWSGLCPWCARELREASDAEQTYTPPLAQIAFCPRHLAALRRSLTAHGHGDGSETALRASVRQLLRRYAQ